MQAAGWMELDTPFIGGGGYMFPRYVEAVYPHATVDSIEIGPSVIRTTYEHLGLSRETRIRLGEDARPPGPGAREGAPGPFGALFPIDTHVGAPDTSISSSQW